jgi:predicted nuclease of predicted toxin-antitoxin system
LKIKLDENLSYRIGQLFKAAGHDVDTVRDEGRSSAGDDEVTKAAGREDRCLITLDLEFGNPLRYRAADFPFRP